MFPKNKKVNQPSANRQMIKTVLAFVFDPINAAIISTVAAFVAVMTNLQTMMANIDALYSSRIAVLKGIAMQKQAARHTLAQTSFSIMSAVHAYALDQDNLPLAQSMKTALSTLQRMRYQPLVDNMTNIIAMVTPLVPSLADYNITSATITGWTADLTALNNLLTGPGSAVNQRKAINIQIQEALFDAINYLKSNGDTTATLFMETYPAFYIQYVANRKLKPYGHMSTQLRLHITTQSGAKYTGPGEVYIIGTDRSVTLNGSGYALIDYIPFGSHQISITTPTGTITSPAHVFKKGKSVTYHVQVSTTSSTKSIISKSEEELVSETTSPAKTKSAAKK